MNNLSCLAETKALQKYKEYKGFHGILKLALTEMTDEKQKNPPELIKEHRKVVKKFLKAQRAHEKCYERRVSVLGEDHIDTLSSLANLALFHRTIAEIYVKYIPEKNKKEEQLKEYYKFYEKELAIHKREAEKYFDECLRKRQSVLGVDHPETLKTQFSHAEMIHNAAIHARQPTLLRPAEGKYQQCLEKRRTKLGQYSPYTIITINAFASLYAQMKASKANLQKSVELFEESYNKMKIKQGHYVFPASWQSYYGDGDVIDCMTRIQDTTSEFTASIKDAMSCKESEGYIDEHENDFVFSIREEQEAAVDDTKTGKDSVKQGEVVDKTKRIEYDIEDGFVLTGYEVVKVEYDKSMKTGIQAAEKTDSVDVPSETMKQKKKIEVRKRTIRTLDLLVHWNLGEIIRQKGEFPEEGEEHVADIEFEYMDNAGDDNFGKAMKNRVYTDDDGTLFRYEPNDDESERKMVGMTLSAHGLASGTKIVGVKSIEIDNQDKKKKEKVHKRILTISPPPIAELCSIDTVFKGKSIYDSFIVARANTVIYKYDEKKRIFHTKTAPFLEHSEQKVEENSFEGMNDETYGDETQDMSVTTRTYRKLRLQAQSVADTLLQYEYQKFRREEHEKNKKQTKIWNTIRSVIESNSSESNST